MTCPNCHYPADPGTRRCSECGHWFVASGETEPAKPSETVEANVVKLDPTAWGGGPFDVGVDTLVPFVAGGCNTLRIVFVSSSDDLEHAEITIVPQDGDCTKASRSFDIASARQEHECLFGIRNLSEGMIPCDIEANVMQGGVSRRYSGSFTMPVTTSRNANALAAQNISIHFEHSFNGSFNNTVQSSAQPGGDSRVRIGEATAVSGNGVLERLQGRPPLEAIGDLIRSGARSYRRVEMHAEGVFKPLPAGAPPDRSRMTEVQIAFGPVHRRRVVQLFTDDEICIGHSVGDERYSDIVIDAPDGKTDSEAAPYGRISRRHCMLSRKGGDVEICDGVRLNDGNRLVSLPSTNGTCLGGRRLDGLTPLADGELKLGEAADAISLRIRSIRPSGCERCSLSADSRTTCAGGQCPSVLVSRNDGVDIHYVALWGCFDLGNVDRNFAGVELFFRDGAFGWRRGSRAGWLGEDVDFGLSQYGRITVLPVWTINTKKENTQ